MIISSKESNTKPYLSVTYTQADSASATLKDAAEAYLADNDEPKLKYTVRMADLSQAIVDTWEDETINLGDTVRVYDKDLDINVDCRVKKITKDVLNPTNNVIELTNRAYDITDMQVEQQKKLDELIPFNDKSIMDAGIIQTGYIGGNVG